MARFSERKWMYASLALSTFIIAQVLVPRADAKTDPVLDAIAAAVATLQTSIANSATQTQTSVGNTITSTVGGAETNIIDAVSNSATETQDNVGTVHAVALDGVTLDPSDGSSSSYQLFGPSGGPSKSGQITFMISGPVGTAPGENKVTLMCDVTESRFPEFEFTAPGVYTQDFTCTMLTLVVYDNAGAPNAGPVRVDGLLQYTTAVDKTTLT